MEEQGENTANGWKYRRRMKLSAVKMKFLGSINLKELLLEMFSLLGIPTELEIGDDLRISCFSPEQAEEVEVFLQDFLCHQKFPIDVECFGRHEWQLLKYWLGHRFEDSQKRMQASVVQNGDLESFMIELVGFKDCVTHAECEMLSFLHGKELWEEDLIVGSRELLRFKDLQCGFLQSPFQVECKLNFDLRAPAILFRGPRLNIKKAKFHADKLLYKEALSVMSPKRKRNDLPFHLSGDTALFLCKADSRKLLSHVDVLIRPLREGERYLQDSDGWPSYNGERESFRLWESETDAVLVLRQMHTNPGGKLQRVINMVALPKRLQNSEQSPDVKMALSEALRHTLEYAEQKGFSSLAIQYQKMENDLLSEEDYTSSVVNGLWWHSRVQRFTSLKDIIFNSDDDGALSMFFKKSLEKWRVLGSVQRDAFPRTRGTSDIQVEVATGLIAEEKIHVVAVLVPLLSDGMKAFNLKSFLGMDGGVIDDLCRLIPEMPELLDGEPVVLPVQPYTQLKFHHLVLLGVPVDGHDFAVITDKVLSDVAKRCLEVCDQSLSTNVTICIPDLNDQGVSAHDVIRILSDAVSQFSQKLRVIKHVRLLLQPQNNSSGAEKGINRTIENLGLCITEDPYFVKYLTECHISREDISSQMGRFGVKMTVCPESQCLIFAPQMHLKSSEQEVRTWTHTTQAALQTIKQQYVIHAVENPALVALLNKHRKSLLEPLKTIISLNETTLIGQQLEIKHFLTALGDLAFQNETVKRGWRASNSTMCWLVAKCIKQVCARKYPRLQISQPSTLPEVLLEGSREEVIDAEKRCSGILSALLSAPVQQSKEQVTFLKAINLDKFNKDFFFSRQIRAGLVVHDDGIKFLGVSTKDLSSANGVLQNIIQEHHINIPDAYQAVLCNTEWVNFIDKLQADVNKEELKCVDIHMLKNRTCPSEVVVVGFQDTALNIKKFLEEYIHSIAQEQLVCSTPGAWQYLKEEGKAWLAHAASAFRCVAEVQPGDVFSLDKQTVPESIIAAAYISSIQIEPVLDAEIVDVETDALICPVAFNMDLRLNPFSRAILGRTGEDITWSQDSLPHGEVFVFSHYQLCCSSVYFANFLHYPDLLGQAEAIYRANIQRCLEESQMSALTSLAIPLMGFGGFGFPLEEEIRWLLEEVLCFTQKLNYFTLKQFRIILPQENSLTTSVSVSPSTKLYLIVLSLLGLLEVEMPSPILPLYCADSSFQ